MTQLSDDAVDDVRSVLRTLGRWRLMPENWTTVQAQLEQLGAALRAADENAVYAAIAGIEESGPTRLAAIPAERPDDAPPELRTEPPPEVVELINTLIHAPLRRAVEPDDAAG